MKPAKALSLRFKREPKPEGEHIFIVTTCIACGASFTGNVADGLPEWEQQHRCASEAPPGCDSAA